MTYVNSNTEETMSLYIKSTPQYNNYKSHTISSYLLL